MNLIELKFRVDHAVKLAGDRAGELMVQVVVHHPGSIGSTPSVSLREAGRGIDWDHGKFLLWPSAKVQVVQAPR